MKTLPTYTGADLISGILNMMHYGAVLLAVVFIVGGLLASRSLLTSVALVAVGGIILLTQIWSRLRHIRGLRRLRDRNGRLEVYERTSGQWISAEAITNVRRKEFPYSDPWRPITVGYPGLAIQLASLDEPIEVLYAYGLEDLRDEVYDYLVERQRKG